MKRGFINYYKGYKLRSLEERKWAVFFDLAGWKWKFEFRMLHYYLPDFALIFGDRVLLAEVKAAVIVGDLRQYVPKIEQSGWDREYILLGDDYDVHLGADLPWPANTEALFREAHREGQWLPGRFDPANASKIAEPIKPSLDHTMFVDAVKPQGSLVIDQHLPTLDLSAFHSTPGAGRSPVVDISSYRPSLPL